MRNKIFGKTKDYLTSWWAAILAIIAALKATYEWYSMFGGTVTDLFNNGSVLLWIIICIIFSAVAILQREIQIRKLSGSSPKVEVREIESTNHPQTWLKPKMEDTSTRNYMGTAVLKTSWSEIEVSDYEYETVSNNEFIHVVFVNNPDRLNGVQTATRVIARLSFFDEKLNSVYDDIDGRWDVPEPTRKTFKGEPGDLLEVEIPSNTRPRRVTVAVKAKPDPAAYAYSHDWYNPSGIKKGDFVLPNQKYFIRITLTGDNTWPDPFWFELKNDGKDAGLLLSPINKPKLKPVKSLSK